MADPWLHKMSIINYVFSNIIIFQICLKTQIWLMSFSLTWSAVTQCGDIAFLIKRTGFK